MKNNTWMKSRFLAVVLVFLALIIPITAVVIVTRIGWYMFGLVVLMLTYVWIASEFRNFGVETASLVKAAFLCLALGIVLTVLIAMGISTAFYGIVLLPFVMSSLYRLKV